MNIARGLQVPEWHSTKFKIMNSMIHQILNKYLVEQEQADNQNHAAKTKAQWKVQLKSVISILMSCLVAAMAQPTEGNVEQLLITPVADWF